jgi:hypothetical protein
MTQAGTLVGTAGALEVLLDALERGNIAELRQRLCRDVCFLTQDRTPIRGRERVDSLLSQLVGAGLVVSTAETSCVELGLFALVSARLQMRLPARPKTLELAADAVFALAHREGEWKLLLVAPWGLP